MRVGLDRLVQNSFYHKTIKKVERYDPEQDIIPVYACEPGELSGEHNEWYITFEENGVYHNVSIITSEIKRYLGNMIIDKQSRLS